MNSSKEVPLIVVPVGFGLASREDEDHRPRDRQIVQKLGNSRLHRHPFANAFLAIQLELLFHRARAAGARAMPLRLRRRTSSGRIIKRGNTSDDASASWTYPPPSLV